MGDFFKGTAAAPEALIAPTSAASEPASSKKTKVPETQALQDAKSTLWGSAFLVVLAIAILGFGSRYLNNLRIA